MRAVIQRVQNASVSISGKNKTVIGNGLMILLGIGHGDNEQDIEWLAGKISRLRIFNDEQGLMNLSVQDIHGEILVISQFTLHASTRKGNRPSFIRAARPDEAIPLYDRFIDTLSSKTGTRVRSGEFGATMQISLVNDGPVTIIIDSRDKE